MKNRISHNSPYAWWLAMRPKTLTGAAIPVMLAGGWAYHEGCFDLWPWLCCLGFACMMQVTANFINDLYDFLRGSDREDRLGPERACAQGWITPSAMRIGIVVAIVVACLVGLAAIALCYDRLPWMGLEYVALGVLCILFAFLYTTCLSYLGLGDILVLVFFGFVPVAGTWYLMQQTLPAEVWLLGAISGISIDALLAINNYRDRDQDRLSGKKTLVVRLGERFGSMHYLATGLIAAGLICPLGTFCLPVVPLYLILHCTTWKKMVRIHEGRALNMILGETSRNMFLMALLLSALLCWR